MANNNIPKEYCELASAPKDTRYDAATLEILQGKRRGRRGRVRYETAADGSMVIVRRTATGTERVAL